MIIKNPNNPIRRAFDWFCHRFDFLNVTKRNVEGVELTRAYLGLFVMFAWEIITYELTGSWI